MKVTKDIGLEWINDARRHALQDLVEEIRVSEQHRVGLKGCKVTKLKMPNEYLLEYRKLNTSMNGEWRPELYSSDFYNIRTKFVTKYAWAIPNQAALDALKKYGPIVEMGAGNGYWAYCMRNEGVDVIAYDEVIGERYQTLGGDVTAWGSSGSGWTEVLKGTPEDLAKHADRTLFICWPPIDHPMATFSLDHYRGNTLIYIGESRGGCTGDDAFHWMLENEWEEIQEICIPAWPHMNDAMTIYRRK